MKSSFRIARAPARTFFAVLCCSIAACYDDPSIAVPEPESVARAEKAPHERGWLRRDDEMAPHVWLASRAAGTQLTEDDERTRTMGRLLAEARLRFAESPRMIANRAVQLEKMLLEVNIHESFEELIKTFNETVKDSRHKHSFGTIVQHYYNLRSHGTSRDDTLKSLSSSFLSETSLTNGGQMDN